MVIYEQTSDFISLVLAIVLFIVAILMIAAMVRFFPLLRKAIGIIVHLFHHRAQKDIKSDVFAVVITAVLYFALLLGSVLCIQNSITYSRYYTSVRNPLSMSGEYVVLGSEVIEYRGDVLGYGVRISMGGEEFYVELPPGLNSNALAQLTKGSEATIYYQTVDHVNVIVKIVMQSE